MIGIFNPVELANQIVVLLVVSVVLAVMIRHWRAVLIAITGDDRVHAGVLDCMWFTFFRCCGLCTGEETRWITRQPCCCCLPEWMKGRSASHELGKLCGFSHHTVELKHIAVGDLPWDGRGDFYLCVECPGNPPRSTSMAEAQLSKVVHFPEVITLRLRNNPLEQEVRITVKELGIWGSSDLCSVHIPAMSLLHWAGDRTRQDDWTRPDRKGPMNCEKRFQMKPVHQKDTRDTPPWIYMEISDPSDERELGLRHVQDRYVRTCPNSTKDPDMPIALFKQKYTLLDHSGHAIQEPVESDLQEIEGRLECVDLTFRWSAALGCIAAAVILFVRSYLSSCYQGIRRVTIADLKYGLGASGSVISTYELERLAAQCHAEFDGTGGVMLGKDPCLPTHEQVMQRCQLPEHGGISPRKQPPVLFMDGALSWLGIDGGLPCGEEQCGWREFMEEWETFFIGFALSYVLYLVLLKCIGHACVRSRKRELQQLRAAEIRDYQLSRRGGGTAAGWPPMDNGAFGSPGGGSTYGGSWPSPWGSPGVGGGADGSS
eukprot:CAMPEP_0170217128 /NCGR_PEP_ID=MMETSP0116_2-20130129/8226_1 /TAXON_ID=400756 /ORGANISM="Durinskia baltica, Strain CSIRO CS-38" /LENGTH=542 /DNA_ID=CAMNT_0010467755 /DNA_START=66 /DNA_END=1690 /DNA_ORIENTATION=-